ncbi:MAG: tRNA pseudouridine(38-40) synthase TruA [Clostridia bacterium]|nr:tRNA pseudouridine(38-40) synthase TruA [Clostridia bacterium]
MRIKLTLSYDGTAYCGWQVQPNGVSVQEVVEKAIEKATGERVRVTGSGRTDSGVHAEGQVAHFDTESSVPADKFYKAINVHLPADVKILKSEAVTDDFHACNKAKKKTYRYALYLSDVDLPLKDRYAVKIDKLPDLSLVQKVASTLEGEHDFKAFCASGSGAKTTVRTVYKIAIEQKQNDILFCVTGNGFLYNMVRIMVGTLLDVGYGKLTENDVKEMLNTGNRKKGGKTLPAKGLCLINVEY